MKRVPATFRITKGVRDEFKANCKERGYPMSLMLDVMISKYNRNMKYRRKIIKEYEQRIASELLEEAKRGL